MSVIFINSYWFAGSPIAPTDPNFNLVSLLLHGDGTNGAQNNTFTDSSTNNFTITRTGNTTQGTFSPFSPTGWSGYFDGTGDYLNIIPSLAFDLDATAYTVETWINFTVAPTTKVLFGFAGTATTGHAQLLYSAGALIWQTRGTSTNQTSYSWTPSQSRWYHIALCWNGSNSFKMFIDGQQVASNTVSPAINQNGMNIGGASDGFSVHGYISNFRILKGTALYTSNFTPPTSPLTAITNTSLLTLQDNRFKDNSINNFTITRNGDTRIEAFSPFNPTAAYNASTHGGSGYFDGTGDYLTTAASNENNFGTSDFTIEFWINSTKTTRSDPFGWNYSFSNAGWAGFIFNLSSSGDMAWYENTNSRISASATGWNNGAWNHVALTRSGNSVRMFLNGTQVGSTYTTSHSYGANSSGFIVGDITGGGGPVNGYISGLRVLKGTAQYTSNFTPPTAPLTAITNTSLLLNFTNAGIIDNASKNVLETVGNAQISTSVKKFGTGSVAFDGTGDWLLLPHTASQLFGTGNFTVEMWLYLSATGAARGLIGKGTATTGWLVSTNSADQVVFTYGSSSIISTGTISASTWTHIAVVREGTGSNQAKIYINGTNDGVGTVNTNFTQTNAAYVGANRTGGDALNGYIDDLRITRGVARYTANFTPPTQAFPDL